MPTVRLKNKLPLTSDQQHWLKRISQSQSTSSITTSPSPIKKQLCFVLQLLPTPENISLLSISLVIADFQGSQFKGNCEAVTFSDLKDSQLEIFLSPKDSLALEKIRSLAHSDEDFIILIQGENSWNILTALLSTQHCYWKSVSQTPLEQSCELSGIPFWKQTENGQQIASLQTPRDIDAILPLTPPAYLFENKVGTIQTEQNPDLIQWWLLQPPCELDDIETKKEELETELASSNLPSPQTYQITDHLSTSPIPILTLFKEANPLLEMSNLNPVDRNVLHAARLEFCYGPHSISALPFSKTFHHLQGKQAERWKRNQPQEQKYLDQLSSMGFIPVSDALPGSSPSLCSSFTPPKGINTWVNFLTYHQPTLIEEGWKIRCSPSFDLQLASIEKWEAHLDPDQQKPNWFSLELGIYVEGNRVNLLPILINLLRENHLGKNIEELIEKPDDYPLAVRLDEKRILNLPIGRIRQLLSVLTELHHPQLSKEGNLQINRLRSAQLSVENSLEIFQWKEKPKSSLQKLGRCFKDKTHRSRVSTPMGIKATLRDYQLEGLNWLQFLREHQLGGILADDMGLGKTIQALAHIQTEKDSGRMTKPCLVVAPTSLMSNWQSETIKFSPNLKSLILQGPKRKQYFNQLHHYDLLFTTYPLLIRDIHLLEKHFFHIVFLDEAQAIKNANAKISQSARLLKTDHRICLTGTPIENHLGELWALFHFLSPDFLGSHAHFRSMFQHPIEKERNQARQEQLQKQIAPFILRRTKEQVAKELPPKTIIERKIELSGDQRDLYESVRLAMHEKVIEEINKIGLQRSQILILDALLKLRQICCHPQLLKLNAAQAVHDSAKLNLLMEMVPQMIEEGRRILIFSSFTSMLALIEKELYREKIPFVTLTGSTRNRAEVIRKFQTGNVPIFLISLKAGGTGLNLTQADTVIHFDPWWNPAAENQATDRAHRIGQTNPIFVYKLITAQTVEEKIAELQEKKKKLADIFIRPNTTELSSKLSFSNQDIENLFQPMD